MSIIPLPFKIAAGVFLVSGAFSIGYIKGSESAKIQIQAFAEKAAAKTITMQQHNNQITDKIVVKYVDRVDTIKEKQYVYLDQAKNSVPSTEYLPNAWIYVHDSSVNLTPIDSLKSSDSTLSDIKDNVALETVIQNYSTCLQTSQQLINLQQWIKDNEQSINDSNQKK
jgi:hypothetical protein